MQGENRSRVPFDDRAALEELERLQRSIQEYRRRREEAEGEFEEFVGSFRAPAAPDDSVQPALQSAPAGQGAAVAASGAGALAVPSPSVSPPGVPPRPAVAGEAARASAAAAPAAAVPAAPAPVATIPPPEAVVSPSAATTPPAVMLPDTFFSGSSSPALGDAAEEAGEPGTNRRATRGRLPLVLGGAAFLLIAAVLLTRTLNAPSRSSPAPAATDTPAGVPPPAPAAEPVAEAVAPPVPPAEVRALRRVWVRVIVDGNREVERELEADARVPLPAGRTFVIRAGDAGAIRFLLNGQDQGPLGADAQVVTRTFTAPER